MPADNDITNAEVNMNVKENVPKYAARYATKAATILTISLLTGGAASSLLADDAGYHARDLQQTQAQTGRALAIDESMVVSNATSVADASQSNTTRGEPGGVSARENDELSASEKLWTRFERYSDFGHD